MKCITYKGGYKYQLKESFAVRIPVVRPLTRAPEGCGP